MSEFMEDIRTYLAADAEVSNLVGTRIYASKPPVGFRLPAIVYWRTNQRRLHLNMYVEPLIELGCLGSSYDQAQQVARATVDALEMYHGEMNGRHVRALVVDERDEEPDQDMGMFPVRVTAKIMFRDV